MKSGDYDHIIFTVIVLVLFSVIALEKEMIELIFLLIAGHFVADYVFQTDAIATGKNKTLEYAKFGVPWYYWMFTHSITHGLAVFLVTKSIYLGIAETFAHFLIDFAKCEGKINLHVDQFLHVLCKVGWILWITQMN
jgi:hypothetical protein